MKTYGIKQVYSYTNLLTNFSTFNHYHKNRLQLSSFFLLINPLFKV